MAALYHKIDATILYHQAHLQNHEIIPLKPFKA